MTIQDDWNRDLSTSAEFSETVTYTPATGTPETLVGTLDPYSGAVQNDAHLSGVQLARLYIPKSIEPTIGDKFTIDGVVWDFQAIEESDAAGLVLELKRTIGKRAGNNR